MHRIVFLDRATIAPHITLRAPSFAHDIVEHARSDTPQVVERLRGAEIAITNKVPIGAEALAELPDLKLIAMAATGYDVVDVAACAERDIAVCNVRGYAVNTVPEHTFALILALRRSIVNYRQDVIDGEWQRAGQFCFFNHPIGDLAGATLGIIGAGALGQSVAALARAFGMRVLFAAHKGRDDMGALYTPFETVLAQSDVISLHCPMTETTRGLIDADAFARMTRRPLVINTARGGLVDEAALEVALENGQIAGAGFDVTVGEPPDPDSVMMRLAKRPDVILTPHTAWASDEAQQALAEQLIGNLEAFVERQPRNLVTAR